MLQRFRGEDHEGVQGEVRVVGLEAALDRMARIWEHILGCKGPVNGINIPEHDTPSIS